MHSDSAFGWRGVVVDIGVRAHLAPFLFHLSSIRVGAVAIFETKYLEY